MGGTVAESNPKGLSMNVERFQQDHLAIAGKVSDLRALVHSSVVANAEAIAKMIIDMSTAIKLHLAAEDRMLYPALLNSAHADIVRIGNAFRTEMGGIADAYLAFSRQWNTAKAIAAKPEDFRSQANQVFKALHERIQRENKELYPAAERI